MDGSREYRSESREGGRKEIKRGGGGGGWRELTKEFKLVFIVPQELIGPRVPVTDCEALCPLPLPLPVAVRLRAAAALVSPPKLRIRFRSQTQRRAT